MSGTEHSRWKCLLVILASVLVLLTLSALLVAVSLPTLLSILGREALRDAGFGEVRLKVVSSDPYYLTAERIHGQRDGLEFSIPQVDVSYAPLKLVRKQQVDCIVLANPTVGMDLAWILSTPTEPREGPPTILPEMVFELPTDRLLIKDGEFHLRAGAEAMAVSVEGLYLSDSTGHTTISAALGQSRGESLEVALEANSGTGELRFEGQVNLIDLLPLLNSVRPNAVPTGLDIRATPVTVQGTADVNDGLLARWAAVAQIPTAEIQRNGQALTLKSLRLGGTGEGLQLDRAALETTLSINSPYVSTADVNLSAKISGPSLSMSVPTTQVSGQWGDFSYSGKLEARGDVTFGEKALLPIKSAKINADIGSDSHLNFQDLGISIDGLEGPVMAVMTADGFAVEATNLHADKLTIGRFELTDVSAGLAFGDQKLEIRSLTGRFLGGSVMIEPATGSYDNIELTARIQSVSSQELAKLIPQFTGKISGPLSGHIHAAWRDGRLTIYPSELHISKGDQAYFSYPEAAELLPKDSNFVVQRAGRSLQSLNVKTFSISFADPQAPIRLQIAGDGTEKNTAPIDLDLKLKGDITKILELLLGGQIQVRIAE